MKFEDSYFEDEVREGFYVPSMVKRAWAAELEVLSEIDRICKKYDIPYFADWGSLLGAVRHGGFIPWDDDMDISMKRADYNRFMEVAAKELPEGFEVYNYRENEDYWNFVTRVVGKRRICFEEEHLRRFHGFPYIVGVDIFLLDYVCRDEEREHQRVTICNYILAIADGMAEGKIAGVAAEEGLKKIENICGIEIDRSQSMNQLRVQLYDQVVKFFSMFTEEESDYLTRMMPDGLNENKNLRLSKRYYDDVFWISFENTTLPVPIAYDEMLKRRYRDYMQIVKDAGGHDYPFFEAQRKKLQSVLDFNMPEYRFSKESLEKETTDYRGSLKGISREYQKNIEVAYAQLQEEVNQLSASDIQEDEQKLENDQLHRERLLNLIVDRQQKAIDYATMIEKCRAENDRTVHLIESYCEELYQLYQKVSQGEEITEYVEELSKIISQISESIRVNILSRKEIVFMPFKGKYWKAMDSVYRAAKKDPDVDVYVIVLPYSYKEYDGAFYNMQYEADRFPDDVYITHYDDYDFALHQPDIIYVQNPYDQCNTTISVPEKFYSTELKKYTKKLIYIPYFKVEEFTKGNDREYHNMQDYCTVPGVINADYVVCQSENMRQIYIEKLVEFAGEDTRSVWEEKILGLGSPLDDAIGKNMDKHDIPEEWRKIIYREDGTRKKIVLFHVEASSLVQYQERFIEKIKEVLEIFYKYRDEVALIWSVDEKIEEVKLSHENVKVYEEFYEVISEFQIEGWGIYDIPTIETMDCLSGLCDAYYGDASKCGNLFRKKDYLIMGY